MTSLDATNMTSQFFIQKRLQMVTFANGQKIKKRNPKDLEKFRKMKKLSEYLEAMNHANLNEVFKTKSKRNRLQIWKYPFLSTKRIVRRATSGVCE